MRYFNLKFSIRETVNDVVIFFSYNRCYNKKSCRWSAFPLKEKKSYAHIKTLSKDAILMRLLERKGMHKPRPLEEDDPRRIAPHLAPVPPPPTQEIVQGLKSRFDK